jgi:hypothetical protein
MQVESFLCSDPRVSLYMATDSCMPGAVVPPLENGRHAISASLWQERLSSDDMALRSSTQAEGRSEPSGPFKLERWSSQASIVWLDVQQEANHGVSNPGVFCEGHEQQDAAETERARDNLTGACTGGAIFGANQMRNKEQLAKVTLIPDAVANMTLKEDGVSVLLPGKDAGEDGEEQPGRSASNHDAPDEHKLSELNIRASKLNLPSRKSEVFHRGGSSSHEAAVRSIRDRGETWLMGQEEGPCHQRLPNTRFCMVYFPPKHHCFVDKNVHVMVAVSQGYVNKPICAFDTCVDGDPVKL